METQAFRNRWPKWMYYADDSGAQVKSLQEAFTRANVQGTKIVNLLDDRGKSRPYICIDNRVYTPMSGGGAVGYNSEDPFDICIARPEPGFRFMLVALGFPADYEPSFNLRRNGPAILQALEAEGQPFQNTEEDRKDLVWLSNELGRLFQRNPDYQEFMDNFRVCRANDTTMSKRYSEIAGQGCCGSYDEPYVNPATGRRYWVGFNYGH